CRNIGRQLRMKGGDATGGAHDQQGLLKRPSSIRNREAPVRGPEAAAPAPRAPCVAAARFQQNALFVMAGLGQARPIDGPAATRPASASESPLFCVDLSCWKIEIVLCISGQQTETAPPGCARCEDGEER